MLSQLALDPPYPTCSHQRRQVPVELDLAEIRCDVQPKTDILERMFKAKSIRMFGLLIASLAPASLAQGAQIVKTASINSVFVFTASGGPDVFSGFGTNNSPILLPEFNPAVGALTEVLLLYSVQVTTATQVLNLTLSLQPPFGTPIPDPVDVLPNPTTVIALNVGGFPVVTTSPPTLSNSADVPYGASAPIAAFAITNGSITSPDFLLGSFSGLGFVPLTVSTQDFLSLDIVPEIGGPTAGTVNVDPFVVTISGNIQAFYTYTPSVGATLAPEPTYGALSALVFVSFIFWRRTCRAREAQGRVQPK